MENKKDWDYDEIAAKLAMHRVDIGEESIPLVLEEARKRKDADVIAHVAEWFEDRNDIKRYLELAMEAAELGSAEANFWLGHEYRSGENPRSYGLRSAGCRRIPGGMDAHNPRGAGEKHPA